MNETQKIDDLESRLDSILPEPDDDGVFGDGSHEHYAALYEKAYDKADTIAREALLLLKREST